MLDMASIIDGRDGTTLRMIDFIYVFQNIENMKRGAARGSNITFTTKNKAQIKNIKKHSKLLLREMQIKYSFNDLQSTSENLISNQIPSHKSVTKNSHPNHHQQQLSTVPYTCHKSIANKKKENRKRKLRNNYVINTEADCKQIVNDGWSSLLEKKRFSEEKVEKIKVMRKTLKENRTISTSSIHCKENRREQMLEKSLPFENMLSGDPDFVCKFSTGFTQDDKQDNFNTKTSVHKSSLMLRKSQNLNKLYRKTVKSKQYLGLKTNNMTHNFVSLAYFLERRNKVGQKQQVLMQKCHFI